MDFTWVKTRNINGCKTFAASIAQTLVDKQVKFQILSYKLGLGKSLTGLGLKKFKNPWAWACPNTFSTPEYWNNFLYQYCQQYWYTSIVIAKYWRSDFINNTTTGT
jgi:hypothetical protein